MAIDCSGSKIPSILLNPQGPGPFAKRKEPGGISARSNGFFQGPNIFKTEKHFIKERFLDTLGF